MTDDLEQLRPTLEAGLVWLYDTEQPEDALVQHHGVALPAVGDRWLKFCPQGSAGRPTIVIDVACVQWGGPYEPPKNPLAQGEPEQLASMIKRSPIARTWNGHPGITGSIALTHPAHPSLLAAVDRYRVRCPEHGSVFCARTHGCRWFRDGDAKVVAPRDPHYRINGTTMKVRDRTQRQESAAVSDSGDTDTTTGSDTASVG